MGDVVVSDIVMRDPVNHPLFVHQSGRLRAPEGTTIGQCRRTRFDNINVSGANPRFPCGLTGQKGYPIEDVTFRSEEHTSELQSLMRISYAVFCLKKKKNK